jgi:arginase family enzyme
MSTMPKYFKRVFDDYQVLVKVNPADWTGTELIIHPDGKVEKTEMEFDEDIFEDLELLQNHYFPVLLGGGHDLAFACG